MSRFLSARCSELLCLHPPKLLNLFFLLLLRSYLPLTPMRVLTTNHAFLAWQWGTRTQKSMPGYISLIYPQSICSGPQLDSFQSIKGSSTSSDKRGKINPLSEDRHCVFLCIRPPGSSPWNKFFIIPLKQTTEAALAPKPCVFFQDL